jgi:hypothetical protein
MPPCLLLSITEFYNDRYLVFVCVPSVANTFHSSPDSPMGWVSCHQCLFELDSSFLDYLLHVLGYFQGCYLSPCASSSIVHKHSVLQAMWPLPSFAELLSHFSYCSYGYASCCFPVPVIDPSSHQPPRTGRTCRCPW